MGQMLQGVFSSCKYLGKGKDFAQMELPPCDPRGHRLCSFADQLLILLVSKRCQTNAILVRETGMIFVSLAFTKGDFFYC